MTNQIYLDYAAATPADSAALLTAKPYFSNTFFNPSAVYESARSVRRDLEKARAQVAHVLGAKDQEILFTAGGTEANNIAIHGVMRRFPKGNIVVSSIEHESVLEPANKYLKKIAPVTKKGVVDLEKLESLIDENTVLVSIMYANNEIGTVQPLKEIAKIIQKKRTQRKNSSHTTTNYPLIFHTDACQAANYLDLQIQRLGVDLMTLNGGKIYGFKQSGCLYVRAGVELDQFILGGGQERTLRSGTENVGSQIAFATMLFKVQTDRKAESERIKYLRQELWSTLVKENPTILLSGDEKKRLPNNLNILIPGADGERLVMELDELGIMVATGSACSASSDSPSHVLLALGLSEAEASASLRITLGRPTTESEIKQAATRISQAIARHSKLV